MAEQQLERPTDDKRDSSFYDSVRPDSWLDGRGYRHFLELEKLRDTILL